MDYNPDVLVYINPDRSIETDDLPNADELGVTSEMEEAASAISDAFDETPISQTSLGLILRATIWLSAQRSHPPEPQLEGSGAQSEQHR